MDNTVTSLAEEAIQVLNTYCERVTPFVEDFMSAAPEKREQAATAFILMLSLSDKMYQNQISSLSTAHLAALERAKKETLPPWFNIAT
jgi:hypothetical protein